MSRDGLALIVFAALTGVLTNPLILHIANAVEDKQDALLNTWIIAWVGHALITDPLNLFNANIFYPYPNALAFSETMLPQGLFALPFNLAFDNTVLGYNLVLLFSFLLAAYAMYLFVFNLTRQRGAGIAAGIVFAFNPYNLGNLAQVQLLSFGWLPLAMLYLRRVLETESSKQRQQASFDSHFDSLRSLSVRSGGSRQYFRLTITDFRLPFWFALFFSLQALSSFYYAFLAGFAVALYVIWFFMTHHAPRVTPHTPRFTFYVSRFTKLALSVLLIALLVIPFFLPYLQVQRAIGFERKVVESEPFSASLKLYIEVSPQNVLYGNWLAPHPPIVVGGYPLDNLFPGFIALGLGLVGIAGAKDRERWFYFLLLAFAFLLSLGPRLFITPSLGSDITLPYRWLYDALPLLRALRAPVRFDALVMLALAVLAALGIHRLTTADHRLPSAVQRFLPSAFCLLIPFEYLAIPAANITRVPTGSNVPQFARWLARQPRTTILELPMLAGDLTPQYLSTYHWQRTPDGYSGFIPPRRGEIAYEMQFFPNERAISLLQALDVEYVILHTNQFADWAAQREAIGREPQLRLVKQMASDFVYHVVSRAQDASALTAQVYLPNPAAPSQDYLAYVIVQNRAARSFAIKPTETLRLDARWSDGTTQQIVASLPLVTSSVSVVPVRLLAPPRAGAQRLDLRVSSAAIGEWRLFGPVTVQEGEPARQVVLPARVVLSGSGVTPPSLKSSYAPGNAVEIALMWLPLNKIDAYYSASVRVVDARGNKIVAQDRQPATPTLLWTPGVVVPDHFTLTLPRALAPGEYVAQLLMYQADVGVDALLLDEVFNPREVISLGTFVVK